VQYDESFFRFNNTVPDGSYLVVTAEDAAGNDASTLLIVNNTEAVNVNLDRVGLENFDFGTIDLSFAPEANLTITEAQIMALTDSDHTLIVRGDSADHVTAHGAVDTGQTVEVDGAVHHVYTLGDHGATLLIDDQITSVTI
jgi:large repetitive protein